VRFQTLSACLTALVVIVGCDTTAPYNYSGRVVDRRGRAVGDATVIGHKLGPTPDEVVIVGGPVERDGTFELPSREKLDEIVAVSRGAKREVTLKNPKPTGNVLVLP
jgi:hypothetical protein